MMGVIASEPDGEWVKEQLELYQNLHFIKEDGSLDMMPNTSRISESMKLRGFLPNGLEQDYKDLHIFPTDYFSPRQTTGEYILTANTYSDHLGAASWADSRGHGWKSRVLGIFDPKMRTKVIKLIRKLIG